MPSLVYSCKAHEPTEKEPSGRWFYARTGQGNDYLAWVNEQGESVSESQYEFLKPPLACPRPQRYPILKSTIN